MYDAIAVPLDGSDAALRAVGPARRLAGIFGARLTLVSVRTPALERSISVEDVLAVGENIARSSGAERVDTLVIEGPDAAAALGRYDAEYSTTLICMSTRGRGVVRRAVLGHTALSVVRHSPFAVVLIGPRCDIATSDPIDPIDPIITCLDGTSAAEAVLPWVERWSRATGAPVALIGVVYPLGAPGLADPPSPEQLHDLRYLDRVASRLHTDGIDVRSEVLPHEQPLVAIRETVHGLSDALIAVATTHPGALEDLVAGSISAELIRSAEVPVLVCSAEASDGRS